MNNSEIFSDYSFSEESDDCESSEYSECSQSEKYNNCPFVNNNNNNNNMSTTKLDRSMSITETKKDDLDDVKYQLKIINSKYIQLVKELSNISNKVDDIKKNMNDHNSIYTFMNKKINK